MNKGDFDMKSKLTTEQREQFKIDSETMTLKELAEKYNMEQCTVSKWRYQFGLGRHYAVQMPSVEQFGQEVQQFTNVELAEKYGVGLRLISKWRVKMGLANIWQKQTVNWEQFDKDSCAMRWQDVCKKYNVSHSVMKLWKKERGLTTGKKEDRVVTWIEVPSTKCWICTSHRVNDKGYPVGGHVPIAKRKWVELNGEWPKGMSMLHSCDNPACVNPEHIRPGTRQENSAEMAQRHRSPWGERNGLHKLKSDQARDIYALKESGESIRSVGKRFGVSGAAVWHIWNDVTWIRDVAGMKNFEEPLSHKKVN